MYRPVRPSPIRNVIRTMSKARKKKSRKVTVSLPDDVVRSVDAEVERLRSEGRLPVGGRSTFIRDVLFLGLARLGWAGQKEPESRLSAREALLRDAGILKLRGKSHQALGEPEAASSAYLAAAARELEALAVLGGASEATIKTHLIEIVYLIKLGTGYRHLPDVPAERVETTPVQ